MMKWNHTIYQKNVMCGAAFTKLISLPFSKCFRKDGYPTRLLLDSAYVNLEKSSSIQFHGGSPFKSGRKVSKHALASAAVMEFFTSDFCPKEHRLYDLSSQVIMLGGFNATLPHLQNFGRRNIKPIKSYNKVQKTLGQVIKRFEPMTECNIPHAASVWFQQINPVAAPGGWSGERFKNKLNGWATSCETATKLWSIVSNSVSPAWSYFTTGERPKRNKRAIPGDPLQCRIIMMQDQVEYQLARPWTFLLEQKLLSLYDSPICLGKSQANEGFYHITRKDRIYPWSMETDWSLFDSTMAEDIMIGSFALMRGMFPQSKHVDNIFFYFATGTINKYVALHDRRVYTIKGGNPSGTVFTALLNSFANAILLEYCVGHYNGRASTGIKFHYDVSGDDGKVFFESRCKFSLEKFSAFCYKTFSMTVKVEMMGPPIGYHPEDSLEFLKLCLYWEGDYATPTLRPSSLRTRISLPQKNYNTRTKLENFLFSQVNGFINQYSSMNLLASLFAYNRCWSADASVQSENMQFDYLNQQNIIFQLCNLCTKEIYLKTDINREIVTRISEDRFKPIDDQEGIYVVDEQYVRNWLLDNTISGYNTRDTSLVRKSYLIRTFGEANSLFALEDSFVEDKWRFLRRINKGLPTLRKDLKSLDWFYRGYSARPEFHNSLVKFLNYNLLSLF
jgi:hypothetical protein